MEQMKIQILFALIRSAVCKTQLTAKERDAYSQSMLPDIFDMSKKHDVSQLLAFGMKQNGLLNDENSRLENHIFSAVYRCELMKYESENLCSALDEANIPFILLKGAEMRKLYPETWMRTSCDIDVLVHEKDVFKASEILTERYGYTRGEKGAHDISLFAPSGTHVELHYRLFEDGVCELSSEVLKNVWDTAFLEDGFSHRYKMSDEMYYFYHIAHAAKHLKNGGCGIRTFTDLFLLDNMRGADMEKRDRLLRRGGLLKFAKTARDLSRVWMSGGKHSPVTLELEAYILRGGAYGSLENLVSVEHHLKGGFFGYALSKIFLPYERLKFHYPILQKHPSLTPIMEVRRWGKLLFCGHAKRVVGELGLSHSISKEENDKTQKFLSDIGL